MKAAVCEEANKIVIKEVEEPKFKQDEVFIIWCVKKLVQQKLVLR